MIISLSDWSIFLLVRFWLMLYTRLASPVAVCIAIRGRYTRLAWLANPNPNPNPDPDPNLTLTLLTDPRVVDHCASRKDYTVGTLHGNVPITQGSDNPRVR